MKMLKILYGCLFCSFGLSCAMLQKSEKVTHKSEDKIESSSQLQGKSNTEKTATAELLTFYTDSADHQYWIQLRPKGEFTFSAATGFKGQADKVLISGSVKSSKRGGGLTKTDQKEKIQTEINLQTKSKDFSQKSSASKKTVPSVWWVLGALILVSAALVIFYKMR